MWNLKGIHRGLIAKYSVGIGIIHTFTIHIIDYLPEPKAVDAETEGQG